MGNPTQRTGVVKKFQHPPSRRRALGEEDVDDQLGVNGHGEELQDVDL